MEFQILLGTITCFICFAGILIWQRTRNLAFPLGLFFVYYWTISGGWALVTDLRGGHSGKRYEYLFGKLFGIELDGDYFMALVIYSLFVAAICAGVYLTVKRRSSDSGPEADVFAISHFRLMLFSAVSLVGSFLVVRDSLLEAMLANVSGYQLTAAGAEVIPYFVLHQSLNTLAVIPLAIGIPAYASGGMGRILKSRRSHQVFLGYVALAMLVFGYGIVMGNKSELFFGLVAGVALHSVNAPRIRYGRLIVLGTTALAGVTLIDIARGFALTEMTTGMSVRDLLQSFEDISKSNEAFAAHFSLYGALHFQVAKTYGTSVLSLLASIVPRVFWESRPDTIYAYYAQSVGAVRGQGYTIHHATGWFLNFGVPGVLLGGWLLGWMWARLFSGIARVGQPHSRSRSVACAIAFSFFTGGIPDLMRVGLEGYKQMLVYSVVMPVVIVHLASSPRGRWWRSASSRGVPGPVAGASGPVVRIDG
jgi:hypothetical protein